jgi:hypothetical protein
MKPPDPPELILKLLISPPPTSRPTTPPSLKPFIILHDPIVHRTHSTLPSIPSPPPTPPPSANPFTFSSPTKRPVKRDPWPRDAALEIHTHILHLREQYQHQRAHTGSRVREFTVKTPNFFIYRTVVPCDERAVADFAEGWYVVKIASGQQQGSAGLGRGDDAGGLEDIARSGREKCREIWREMNDDSMESDDES